MKFSFNSLFLSALALTLSTPALSQRISIGAPADLTTVHAGSSFTVEIDKPNSLSGSTEVALVIGLNSCHNTTCIPPAEILGTILYNDKFTPVATQPTAGAAFKPPHQNFTLTVPKTFAKGRAVLAAYHVALIGAGPEPFTEIQNITLNIV